MSLRLLSAVGVFALAVPFAAVAPSAGPAETRSVLLFARDVTPPADNDADRISDWKIAWFLVDPDGKNVRPLVGKDGTRVAVPVPAVTLRANVPQRIDTLQKPDGTELTLQCAKDPLAAAYLSATKPHLEKLSRDAGVRAAHPRASENDRQYAKRIAALAADPRADLDTAIDPEVPRSNFRYVGFSPDQRRLGFLSHGVASEFEGAFVLDIPANRVTILRDVIRPPKPGDVIETWWFSPDLSWVAYFVWEGRNPAAGKVGRVFLHVAETTKWKSARLTEIHPDLAVSTLVEFTPDNKLQVGGTTVRVFDPATGKVTREFSPTNDKKIEAVSKKIKTHLRASFSPCGRYVLVCRRVLNRTQYFVYDTTTEREIELPEDAVGDFGDFVWVTVPAGGK